MIKKGEFAWQEVSYYGRIQKKPIALRQADPSKFSGSEVNLIRLTVEKFWAMSATDISEQSHLFLCKKDTKTGYSGFKCGRV